MGVDSCSSVCGFKWQQRLLDGHWFKLMKKRPGIDPLKMFNGHLAEKSRVQMKVVPSIILCTKFGLFQNDPIPNTFLCIVVLFSSQFKYKLKKRRCCAWVSNPGPQECRHRGAKFYIGRIGIKNRDPCFESWRLYHFAKTLWAIWALVPWCSMLKIFLEEKLKTRFYPWLKQQNQTILNPKDSLRLHLCFKNCIFLPFLSQV